MLYGACLLALAESQANSCGNIYRAMHKEKKIRLYRTYIGGRQKHRPVHGHSAAFNKQVFSRYRPPETTAQGADASGLIQSRKFRLPGSIFVPFVCSSTKSGLHRSARKQT